MADLTDITEFLRKNNVNLISITEGINTMNPYGKPILHLSGIFAEIERDNIIEASRMGMEQRARKGRWNGGLVFGYRSNDNKELEIIEEEAAVVKKVFTLYGKEGWGYREIANYLNKKGV